MSPSLTKPLSTTDLDESTLKELYVNILKPRLIEEKMLILLRLGKISKWFSGIGQEAISVGIASAIDSDEYIFTMHRNLGVFTTRKLPLHRLFGQWQGKMLGYTKGRDRSFHFGSLEDKIVGMISHLGPQLSLACGVALGHKISGRPKIAVAFTGEGGTSEGEFHEALNVAAVWQLPVLFVIENNGYALSTPTNEQYRCKFLSERGKGYGIKSLRIDGNDAIKVYETISKLAIEMRKNPKPILLECTTFRIRGHEEASGVKYVPHQLIQSWKKKDPVQKLEKFLLKSGVINKKKIDSIKQEINDEINAELKIANEAELVVANLEKEYKDIFRTQDLDTYEDVDQALEQRRFIDAISDALDLAMSKFDNLILMGQDIADYGGVFKITDGFLKKYGSDRVRNTPLCESAIVGIGLGLSFEGFKSMVEMQFADFVTCGFNQIVNNLAKIHYRWGANADVVIRMPCGGGVGAGPFHSQTNEAWFFKTPGLKIVYPSNPYDAKGLLLRSFEDPNPVLFFEHKALYRSKKAEIPSGYYSIPFGEAAVVRSGSEACIITYGMAVHWAVDYVDANKLDIEIIDLRTLNPLDYSTIESTVKKCNRVILLHEDTLVGGIGAELSAFISENLFEYLDAPIMRVASLDTPVPFAKNLEAQFLPIDRLGGAIDKILKY